MIDYHEIGELNCNSFYIIYIVTKFLIVVEKVLQI